MDKRDGFTLIELMVVVSVISILAAIAIPRMGEMMRKSYEASTKGNLSAMRSALSVYFSDTEGMFPSDDLTSLTQNGKYMNTTFKTYVRPWHQPGNTITAGNFAAFTASSADYSNWWYFNDRTENQWGMIIVNCIHTDAKGAVWTSY